MAPPLYAVAWLSPELLFIAGGGGKKSSGIKKPVPLLADTGMWACISSVALEQHKRDTTGSHRTHNPSTRNSQHHRTLPNTQLAFPGCMCAASSRCDAKAAS